MPYLYASYVSNISSFLEEIQWNEQTSIIGHSMSAGISMLFAGMYPERVNKLLLIDGFGPIAATASKTPELLKKAINQENAFYKGSAGKDKKVYENVGKAIDARVRNVSSYPGKQSLSREAASALVCRGTMLVNNNNDDEDIDENNPNSVVFRHDPRLFLPSYTYFSNEQILHFIDGITSKTLLIQGENGWPVESSDIIERKKHFESKENLLTHKILPGSHHLHLDPLTRSAVGLEILNFLKQ
jgi:pimeloyl-ACP methyl ester carboxylesterase